MITTQHDGITISGNELVSVRILNAPRELVFKTWTEAEHLAQWWGPNGFTLTTKEMNATPGGIWRFTFHGPDGTDYLNLVQYEEVAAPERLVYRHGGEGAHADIQFHVTVTFEEQEGKTKLTMRMVFATAAELERVVKASGAIEGNKQTMNKLAAYLEKLSS